MAVVVTGPHAAVWAPFTGGLQEALRGLIFAVGRAGIPGVQAVRARAQRVWQSLQSASPRRSHLLGTVPLRPTTLIAAAAAAAAAAAPNEAQEAFQRPLATSLSASTTTATTTTTTAAR